MTETVFDYALAIFFFIICFVFVLSMYVGLPERNDNEFSE
jgi:hypothetical protein